MKAARCFLSKASRTASGGSRGASGALFAAFTASTVSRGVAMNCALAKSLFIRARPLFPVSYPAALNRVDLPYG